MNFQNHGHLVQNQQISQYEYSIDGNLTKSNPSMGSHQLKNKVNPVSGGIPISTILPQRITNSELTTYQSEKKLRGFNQHLKKQGNRN